MCHGELLVVSVCVCVFVCIGVCVGGGGYVRQSVCLVCLRVCLSVCLYVCIYVWVCLYLCLYQSINKSINQYIYLSIYLSIYPSIYLMKSVFVYTSEFANCFPHFPTLSCPRSQRNIPCSAHTDPTSFPISIYLISTLIYVF